MDLQQAVSTVMAARSSAFGSPDGWSHNGRRQYGDPHRSSAGGWFSQVVARGIDDNGPWVVNMEGVPRDPSRWFLTLYRGAGQGRWAKQSGAMRPLDVAALAEGVAAMEQRVLAVE